MLELSQQLKRCKNFKIYKISLKNEESKDKKEKLKENLKLNVNYSISLYIIIANKNNQKLLKKQSASEFKSKFS